MGGRRVANGRLETDPEPPRWETVAAAALLVTVATPARCRRRGAPPAPTRWSLREE